VRERLDEFTYEDKRLALRALGCSVTVWRRGVRPHRFEVEFRLLSGTIIKAAYPDVNHGTDPGFLMLEYQGKLLDAINASLAEPIRVEASQIAVPTGPGLGVQLNEAALAPHWRMIE
jgi:hypothetical protein